MCAQWCLAVSMTESHPIQEDPVPELHNVKRHAGIAGQYAVSADVEYPDEPIRSVEFVGSVYGGPVVIRWPGYEGFVEQPERFGKFGVEWVRRFFS